MSKPGFRKGRSGGSGAGRESVEGFISSSWFSQAQILSLMKIEFARSRRHGIPLGCVMLQVDRMSQLVDLYGAQLRNSVRETLSQLVRDKTRGADMLGMVNEDRYLLMLPHTDLEQVRIVATRVHVMFQEYEVTMDDRPLALTLSVGFTATGDQQAMFFDSLVGQAETALQWAMQQGGDRVTSFGETQLMDGDQSSSPEQE